MHEWHALGVVSFSWIPCFSQGLLLIGGIFLGKIFSQFAPQQQQKYLFHLFTLAYLSRIIVCYSLFAISYFTDRPGTFLGGDDTSYMYNGLGFSQLADAGIPLPKGDVSGATYSRDGSFGYVTSYVFTQWNVFLFQWLGRHPLSVLVVHCLLGAVTIFPLFFLGKEFFSSRAGKVSATLGAFFPSTFLWSTQDLKEALVNLLMMVLFLAFARLRKKSSFINLVLAALFLYWISLFRHPIHWVLLIGFLISWLMTDSKIWITGMVVGVIIFCVADVQSIKGYIKGQLNIFFIDAAIVGGNAVERGLIDINNISESENIMETVARRRHERTTGTAILRDIDLSSWQSFILWLPVLLFVLLTAPYPWQIIKPSVAFASIEMMFWYFLIPATLWGIKYGFSKRISLTLMILLPLFMYGILISFVEPNVGLLMRHRGIVFILLFIFTGAGLVYRKTKLIEAT